MKKAVIIISYNKFRDEEYFEPKHVLESQNISVTTASTELGQATGKLGASAEVDIEIGDINVEEFDAVVFVGGPGSYDFFDDITIHNIARDAILDNKVIAAICAAPGILASAGLLKGKNVTCFPGIADLIKKAGATYTQKGVEIDNNLITADGPTNATKFGESIAWKILK